MKEGIPGIIVIAVLLTGVLLAVLMNRSDRPAQPGLELSEADRVRDVSDRSDLFPLGWTMIVIGSLVTAWAWLFMDVTPSSAYSDVVNIDAVSQRAMLHTAGLVTVAIGAVCACAGHVINEIRRGR